MINKEEILKTIINDYESKLEKYKKAMDEAQKEANFHKGAMESRYDTFKEEAQMLKEGFARQFNEVNEILKTLIYYQASILNKKYRKVLPGAIVKCTIDGNEEKYFFIIQGIVLQDYIVGNIKVTTLNSEAPLAKKIINLEEGEETEFNGKTIEINKIY